MKITATSHALRLVISGKDDVTLQPGESFEGDDVVVEARALGVGPAVDPTVGGSLGSTVNDNASEAAKSA
jgi:hypothetical protein